jgi:hypothetical protein
MLLLFQAQHGKATFRTQRKNLKVNQPLHAFLILTSSSEIKKGLAYFLLSCKMGMFSASQELKKVPP